MHHSARFNSPAGWFCFILQGLTDLLDGFVYVASLAVLMDAFLLHFARFSNLDRWFWFIVQGLAVMMDGFASFCEV